MTARLPLSTHVTDGNLGVLSVHLEGGRCRVGCEFCYLGARTDESPARPELDRLLALLEALPYRELAVALSEPIEPALPALAAALAVAHRRGVRTAVTTTLPVAARLALARGGLEDASGHLLAGPAQGGVHRLSLSVDPRKGTVEPARVEAAARAVKSAAGAGPAPELVLIVSLVTPEFAHRLIDEGLLEALVDLPSVDAVALNALKPPPPWCGRAFWMRTLATLRPLLARALDRRLFLDCWVAARLLGLGGCPARADLSPTRDGGVAFRSCVYQPSPELVADDAAETARRLAGFTPPAVCPFPIPD